MESDLKKKWIKAIELGPRQILFGLDMDDAHLTDLVLSCIARQCIMHGQASLHTVIEELTTRNGLPESDTLQIIFGFVHELKIGFYCNGQPITAPEVKKTLLKNTDTDIRLILNKQVQASTFQAVQQIFQLMGAPFAEYKDQHAFAFAALHLLEQWRHNLKTWYFWSKTDRYPGKGQIKKQLAFTAHLLQNRTAHSLLTTCFNQKDQLSVAADEIRKISTFFTKDLAFWDTLGLNLPRFAENKVRIRENPDIAAAYNQLTVIYSSPDPFDNIQTARDLFNTVNAFHQQVEAQKLDVCRQQAMEKIDGVIRKLTADLAIHNVDPDTCNQILLALRQTRKKIGGLPDIDQVNRTCRDAIDLAMDHFEEVISDK